MGDDIVVVAPWCSGYRYCRTAFNKTWTQVPRWFKSCSRRVGDSRWWVCLTMVPAGNKVKRLSLVNHTTKTFSIHHHDSKTNVSTVLASINFIYSSKRFDGQLTWWRKQHIWLRCLDFIVCPPLFTHFSNFFAFLS